MDSLGARARAWVASSPIVPEPEYYCETRDRFDVRLASLAVVLNTKHILDEETAYFVKSIAGEIGNNSFDHNVGNWPDIPGIFFGYDLMGGEKKIILADRGRGVLATLQKVKPELQTHEAALRTAFTERLSARLPERRGNGLKFVRESVAALHLHLDFFSGDAKADLNETMSIQTLPESIQGCLAILTFSDRLTA